MVAVTWAVALGANWAFPDATELGGAALAEHEHGAWSYGAALLLLGLLARAVWRDGLRSWLGSLGEALAVDAVDGTGGPGARGHAHGHGHGHVGGEAAGHSHSHSH